MKKVFFTPQYPAEPKRGMGYIEIDEEIVTRVGIIAIYRSSGYGGRLNVVGPDGIKFTAYCDNPYGFGGRNKRSFVVHSHGEAIRLVAQKKLTIDAVLHFVSTWADKDAKVITPGKRTMTLSKEKAKHPCYVYFVLNRDSKAIKIGLTKNIQRRLAALQTSSPAQLELLLSIKVESVQAAKNKERWLHEKFAELRIVY
jgi:predicted GIY-YIG superfamily endonuclease